MFDESAFLRALLTGGNPDPCDPAYWSPPPYLPEFGVYACYAEHDFDFIGWLGSGRNPLAPSYWSEDFDASDFDWDGMFDCLEFDNYTEMNSACEPPGVWPQFELPSPNVVAELATRVRIRRGPIEWFDDVLGGEDDHERWEECEKPLIEMAWALLVQNADIIQWVMCLVTGGRQDFDCLMNLLAPSQPISTLGDIRDILNPLDEWSPIPWPQSLEIVLRNNSLVFQGQGLPWNETVQLNAATDWWALVTEMWCANGETSRQCAAIAVAALLLEEMLHICDRSIGLDHNLFDDYECDKVIMAHNTFLAVMLERYHKAADNPCCSRATGHSSGGDAQDMFASHERFSMNSTDCNDSVFS